MVATRIEPASKSYGEEATQAQLLRLMALFIVGGGALFSIVALGLWQQGHGSFLDALGAGGLAVCGSIVWLLSRRGRQRAASVILVGLLVLIPTYYVLLEGPRNTGLLLLVGAVVYSDFLLGGRSGLVVAPIGGVLYGTAGLAYEQGWLEAWTYSSPLVADVITVAVVCFALALSASFFTREMRRALQQAHRQEEARQASATERDLLFAELEARDESHRRLLEQVQELGSPIIPLGDRVVAMPIIGMVDSRRATDMTANLLQGVERLGARFAIIDMTGVLNVDAVFGMMLLQMAQGAQLLGAEPVLTGVRPAVAEALVNLGLDFSLAKPQPTLQEGLDYALDRLQMEKANGLASA